MKLLITGGCGFLGSNLADYAISQNFCLTVFDNLSRFGSSENLAWLKSRGEFTFVHGDIRNRNDVESLIREGFDAVFHLAGQVAMTTSMENPRKDFEINALGTFNVLDSVLKYCKNAVVVYSSTNKVYGELERYEYVETDTRYVCPEYPQGFDESVPLEFHSPYGCSKGCADQYMLDYHRIFGLKTVVFRHSSMYGGRQFATFDQGWIGWFCKKAVELSDNHKAEPFTISGNGKQVRDILHADDMVDVYYRAVSTEKTYGNAFNIGGSMKQSLSLLELFHYLNDILNVDIRYTRLPVRASDQKIFVADISKISSMTGWTPRVRARDGIVKMLDWVKKGLL
ncbi:MAG: GDP-mannose 4,6-dehydratase [Chitinispirillales bacterium]|jgi:CDP-paratose 2-epimerase|nr:GDP-mannose 4,6-dehydratase [Chitinispirillales bacterium]